MAFLFRKKKEKPKENEFDELPPLPDFTNSKELAEKEAPQEMPDTFNLPPIRPSPEPAKLPEKIELPEMPAMEEAPKMPARELAPPSGPAPVFVKIDKYKEIMHTIQGMQDKVSELQVTLNKISSIKKKEEEIIQGWNALLAEAKTKVEKVNSKLLKPEEA